MEDLNKHFGRLLDDQWQFLLEEWPTMEPLNNHRTSIKNVGQIKAVKNKLMKRLEPIPVFFFLVVLWTGTRYPGPYREVEKGLLLLYYLITGNAMDAMESHIPKSSFHAIHAAFFHTHHKMHAKVVTKCLATMFSTIHI
jgi:hypothetical protein